MENLFIRMPKFPFIRKLMAPFKSDEEIAKTWQAIAKDKNLKFISGSRTILGDYRGHHLKLDIVYRTEQYNHPNTRLVCSLNDSVYQPPLLEYGKQFTVTDIINFFTLYNLSDIEIKGRLYFGPNIQICYEQIGVETDVAYLEFLFDLLCDIADGYPIIVAKGAEAIPALQEIAQTERHELQQIAIQLLYDIGRETTTRLSAQISQVLCPNCLLRSCTAHKANISLQESVTYYGCQICGQSQNFFNGQVVAILDNNRQIDQVQQMNILQVNWLIHRKLFDFDYVKIVQATDEEVERFLVQMGNEANATQQSHYKEIRCVVTSECELSENTVKILQKTFGHVKIQ
ncbi:MAG: hypothetical protein GY797_25115 [Deltaproteobacteria bacterium]|nr:hypothetical protein [Deltaproteobacteria bacterium]